MCEICKTIDEIKAGSYPYLIKEMESGYVVASWFQFYRGKVLFISKEHATELHELPESAKSLYLKEMSLVAEAVYRAYKPKKLNYELLGNTFPHLHWHIIPRHEDDPNPTRPAWEQPRHVLESNKLAPDSPIIAELRDKINYELETLLGI